MSEEPTPGIRKPSDRGCLYTPFLLIAAVGLGLWGWQHYNPKLPASGHAVKALPRTSMSAIYDAGDDDWFNSVCSAPDGFILAGLTGGGSAAQRPLLVKLDLHGEVEWAMTTPDEAAKNGWLDEAVCDAQGNVYACGSLTGGIDPVNDAFLLKVDSTGNLVWARYCGGDKVDIARGCTLAGADLYVAGVAAGRGLLLSASGSGELLWQRQCDGPGTSELLEITAGTAALAAVGSERMGSGHQAKSSGLLVEFDREGELRASTAWAATVGDAGSAVCALSEGYLVCGHASHGHMTDTTQLLRFGADLSLQYARSWRAGNGSPGIDVVADSTGRSYVLGYTYSEGISCPVLAVFDSEGGLVSSSQWRGSDYDGAGGLHWNQELLFICGGTSGGSGAWSEIALHRVNEPPKLRRPAGQLTESHLRWEPADIRLQPVELRHGNAEDLDLLLLEVSLEEK